MLLQETTAADLEGAQWVWGLWRTAVGTRREGVCGHPLQGKHVVGGSGQRPVGCTFDEAETHTPAAACSPAPWVMGRMHYLWARLKAIIV